MLKLVLRKVDGSVRNETIYYLVELHVLGGTTKIAEFYDRQLAEKFAPEIADFLDVSTYENKLKDKP